MSSLPSTPKLRRADSTSLPLLTEESLTLTTNQSRPFSFPPHSPRNNQIQQELQELRDKYVRITVTLTQDLKEHEQDIKASSEKAMGRVERTKVNFDSELRATAFALERTKDLAIQLQIYHTRLERTQHSQLQ